MLRLTSLAILAPLPAMAATGPFFSLQNTNFVVLLAFLVFLGILIYFRVPTRLLGMLDTRSDGIRSELDEARALREEAQSLLASYERKQTEVQAQADRIVAQAREEASAAAEQAKADLKATVQRRIEGAEAQIASARTAAINDVRNRAIEIAVAAAGEVLSRQMTPEKRQQSIDRSIETVQAKLH